MTLPDRAKLFATAAHAAVGQVRKYIGEPYINHPAEVVEIVQQVDHTEEMLAAAWLHDVVEDTEVTWTLIYKEFGPVVGNLVDHLADISTPGDGNHATRKEIDRNHTARASPDAKTIKLADLMLNTRTIVQHDLDFAKIYLKEKALLMGVLRDASSPQLWNMVMFQLLGAKEKAGILI